MPGFQIPTEGAAGPPADGGPANTAEMMRKYRWTLRISVPGLIPFVNNFVDLSVASCDRPKVEFKEMEIHNGADVIYRPGKVTYKPISIKYYEAATTAGNVNATAFRFSTWWSQFVFQQADSRYGKREAYAAKCDIKMSDGSGKTMWHYTLYNCWPSTLDPDGLDYSSNEISTYSLTLRYDRFVEKFE